MTTERHPSYLELDRHALGLAAASPLQAHVQDCVQCQQHLTQVARANSVPGWVEALAQTGRPKQTRQSRRRPALWLTAVAAAALLALWPRPRSTEPYAGSKGGPSAMLHVQHDDVASPWDGSALTRGDRIRLELSPDSFRYVTVFSLSAQGTSPRVLFRGGITPNHKLALDKAWQIDGQSREEQLAVLFSRSELSESAARTMLQQREPAEAQLVRLVVPVRAEPGMVAP